MSDPISVDVLLYNLDKVYCGGKFPQIAMNEDMSLFGISDDGSLIVEWSGLNEDVFDHPIGVNDLGLLKAAVSQIDTYADIYVEDNRLIVAGGDDSVQARLILGHPEQVITKLDESKMKKVNDFLDEFPYMEVPSEIFETIKRTQGIFSSDSIFLEISPENGCVVTIGKGSENIGKIFVKEIHDEEEYTLKFSSETFRKILSVLNSDGVVQVKLTGPDSIIELKQGSVRWILNPIAQES